MLTGRNNGDPSNIVPLRMERWWRDLQRKLNLSKARESTFSFISRCSSGSLMQSSWRQRGRAARMFLDWNVKGTFSVKLSISNEYKSTYVIWSSLLHWALRGLYEIVKSTQRYLAAASEISRAECIYHGAGSQSIPFKYRKWHKWRPGRGRGNRRCWKKIDQV